MRNRVSTHPISKRHSSGIGYVSIPLDIDREEYVRNCYLRGAISLILESGGVVDDILVSKESFNNIVFPASSNELGSIVIWVNIPNKNQLVAIGVLNKNNEFIGINENEFSFKRETKSGYIEISGNGKNSDINILVNNNNSSGKVNIIATNKYETAEINLKVAGNVNIYASKDVNISAENQLNITVKDEEIDDKITTIQYTKSEGFKYEDEFGNIVEITKDYIRLFQKDGDIIEINNQGISLGSETKSKEPAILGDTNVNVMQNIVTQIEVINNALIAYCTTQITISSSLPWLAPLVSGYTVMSGACSAITSLLTQIKETDLPTTKSNKITLD